MLAPRRDREGSIDESIYGAAHVDNELPDVHELARQFPDYMDAEQHFVGYSEDEFHQTIRRSEPWRYY